jgi:hypothetical protein
MGCIGIVLALLVPRVFMVFIWLLTNWFQVAFNTALWPILGFLFMPYTTLAYLAAVLNTGGNVNGLWIVLIVIAAVVDLGHWGGTRHYRRRRVVRV